MTTRSSRWVTANTTSTAWICCAGTAGLSSPTTAATLARLNLPAEHRAKVAVLPFGVRTRRPVPAVGRDTIASFGIVDRIKRSDVVVDTFIELARQDSSLRFAIVGHCPDDVLWAELNERIRSVGFADRITLTGRVEDEEYVQWLGRAQLAVQLRAHSNGETSAAVADCMGAGIPTIVSRLGAMSELGDACLQVPPTATVADLVRAITKLLADEQLRTALKERGLRHAEGHSFAKVAQRLVDRANRKRGHSYTAPTVRT
jgi:glycosyltransferase involved in cell wall biosynthesis